MFCSSIRARPVWKTIVSDLSKSKAFKLKECRLNTHDIEILVRGQLKSGRALRICLFSSDDMGKPDTVRRIEDLALLTGGVDVAIVLLLNGQNQAERSLALMNFQIVMLDYSDVCLLPIISAKDLVPTLTMLRQHHEQAAAPENKNNIGDQPSTTEVLRHCVTPNTKPLSETHANRISDVFDNMCDLATGTRTQQGQQRLVEYVGVADAGRVISFFTRNAAV